MFMELTAPSPTQHLSASFPEQGRPARLGKPSLSTYLQRFSMQHSSGKHGEELQTKETAPSPKALGEAISSAARVGWSSLTASPCPTPPLCSQ